jgi:hypothetical protein
MTTRPTTEGAITPDALAALVALKSAGLTSWLSPAGGLERALRADRPVDAIVAENGAVALVNEKAFSARRLKAPGAIKLYQSDALNPHGQPMRPGKRCCASSARQLPGTRRATDSPAETDIAIDP